MRKIKQIIPLIFIFSMIVVTGIEAKAQEQSVEIEDSTVSNTIGEEVNETHTNRYQNELLDTFDYSGIEEIMGDVFPEEKIKFSDLVKSITTNDYESLNEDAYTYITKQIFYELSYNKSMIIHILLLTIFASVFTNFSNAFGNAQIANMGFYIIYLMILIISLQSFQVITQAICLNIEQLLCFMSALCPIYFLAVAFASGNQSSVIFYNLSLLYIYGVELLIISIVIPLINSYIVVEILNYLSLEQKLSKLASLIKKIINWCMKGLLGAVVGLNVVQGLITPVLDSIQRNVWLKGAEAIPVVGDAMSGTLEMMLGSLQLIKNGVGVAGMILCFAIMIGPIIQMVCLTFLYKTISAIIEPISDKRISSVIDRMGDGCEMLLKAIVTTGLLFIITIAIVSATTT